MEKILINLKHVLVVPQIKKKLNSISKLTKKSKLLYVFTRNNCFVKDMSDNKTMIIRVEENELYKTKPSKTFMKGSRWWHMTQDVVSNKQWNYN